MSGGAAIWLSACAVAAFWAVHPLATEAVTNIAGRADLLAGSGCFSALYAHVRGGRRQEAAGTLALASGSLPGRRWRFSRRKAASRSSR